MLLKLNGENGFNPFCMENPMMQSMMSASSIFFAFEPYLCA